MAFTKITASGIGSTETVTLDGLTVINNVSIGGTLTYEDVTNIDSVGLITARAGVVVGSGVTLSKDGDIFATGVTTSTTFVGNLTGNVTGNADTATNSTNSSHILVTDNESANENNLITFVEDATSSTGNVGLEMDGNLTYNPSTGTVSATAFSGDGSALTGVASTENIRTNTNATFLQNINVSGSTTTGTLSLSNSDVALNQFSVGIGTSTTTGYQAGVGTAAGTITFDGTLNQVVVFTSGATAEWKRLKYDFNNGETAANAARSAKELLDNGVGTDGVYFLNMHGAYTQANSKRHYCLMDSSYDGGGWTLLTSHNHGNDFISGTNYHFSHDVGSSPTSVNDFIASNFGYDRRNTFTPAAGDEFLVRRSDNNDWRRFVVTTWSPTANSVSNGWETTNKTDGSNTGHPYWASGTVYGTGGSAESTSYAWHFNGCALAGNCANGGDGAAFSDYSEWAWSTGTYKGYGSAHRGNPGSNLSWGNSALTEGSSLYIHIFYRKSGAQ